MTNTQTLANNILVIEGIKNPIILDYFTTINNQNFTATSLLFTEDGALLAPFEDPIVGQNEIPGYLTTEAKGMKLIPQRGVSEITQYNIQKIKVLGKVQTSLFTVNLGWYFNLNQNQKIVKVRIKLLASPQELLSLKQKR